MDTEGNTLQEDTTETVYVGETYDVSEAEAVLTITKDGIVYDYKEDDSAANATAYIGTMPDGGVVIVRVYEVKAYYYQQKIIFTGYDADGNVIYSATENGAVNQTLQQMVTIQADMTAIRGVQEFQLVSEAVQSADLTGTTEDAPYVFMIYYEFRLGPDEVQPEEPEPTPPAPQDDQIDGPPRTGDDGVDHWIMLMLAAAACLAWLMQKERRQTAGK